MNCAVSFRWLGVAGLELEARGQVLMVDPFFTRPPAWRLGFGRVEPDHALIAEKVARCDYILVTHAHWDHLMDVPDVAHRTGALVLGSPNTCQLLAACGLPSEQIRKIAVGEDLALGSFSVEVLAAEHARLPGLAPGPLPADLRPPLRLRDYRMDVYFSFAIHAGGWRWLDWCGVRPGPATPAEVLFVPAEEGPAHYEMLLGAVRPRIVVPVHWDDFTRPLTRPIRPFFNMPRWAWPPLQRIDLAHFRDMIERLAPEARVLVPEIFRVYDLHALVQTLPAD
jgi:L-ascorbate metabolism protein UlaG (beta-lactamase superfamily)